MTMLYENRSEFAERKSLFLFIFMGKSRSKNQSDSSEFTDEDDDGECQYERIVGMKKEGNKVEYLIKLIGKSYNEVKWFSEKTVGSYKEGAAMVAKITKNNPVATQAPYFDPEYCKVDRIIAQDGDSYLVKWCNLGYDQLTNETNLSEEDISNFHALKQAKYPIKELKDENLPKRPEIINEFPEIIDAFQLHYLPSLNILLQNFYENKSTELYAELEQNYILTISAYIQILFNKYDVRGPYLIVLPQQQINQWSAELRKIKYLKTIVYSGSKEIRKKTRDLEFNEEGSTYGFHIILTNTDVLKKDIEILNGINWRSVVIDGQFKPKIKKFIHPGPIISVTTSRLRTRTCEITKILDVLTNDPIQNIVEPLTVDEAKMVKTQLQHAVTKRANSKETSIPKMSFKIINCPLCQAQKDELLVLLHQYKEEVAKGKFQKLTMAFLRILTHPYILPMREFYNNISYLNASTKMMVATYLINERMMAEEKILLTTEFAFVADMLEDYCELNELKYHRVTPASTELTMAESSVFICDQSFNKLSLDNQFLPHLCALVEIVVCMDGDANSLLSTLKLAMNAQSTIRMAYKLECLECNEAEIYKFGYYNIQQFDDAKVEPLLRRCIMCAFQPEPDVNIIDLISETTDFYRQENYLADEMGGIDFWGIVSDDSLLPKTEDIEISETAQREWTMREVNQSVRYLTGLEILGGDKVAKMSGVRVTGEVMKDIGQALLSFFIRNTRGGGSYYHARQLLTNEKNSQFFDTGVWMQPSVRASLKRINNIYLKRIEMIHLFKEKLKLVDSYLDLDDWGPTGEEPFIGWKDDFDKALVYASTIYGYGNYDCFLIDDDPIINQLFTTPDGEDVQRSYFNDRMMKLGEAIGRLMKPANVDKSASNNKKKSKRVFVDTGVHSQWTKTDKDKLRLHLMKDGLRRNANGECDYSALRLTLGWSDKSVDEVREYVEAFMDACYRNKSEGKKAENKNSDGEVAPATALRVVKHVEALDQLREMINNLSDEVFENKIASVMDRRDLPAEFTAKMEVIFFKKFAEMGFGSPSKILAEEPFADMFDHLETLPECLVTEYRNIKRINAIYAKYRNEPDEKNHYAGQKRETRRSRRVVTKASSGESKGHRNRHESSQKSSDSDIPLINDSESESSESSDESSTPSDSDDDERSPGSNSNSNIVTISARSSPITKAMKGEYKLPFNVGTNIILESLGTCIVDRPHFHTARYIYPAGYKISKTFQSPKDPKGKCKWIASVEDEGKDGPVFVVSCEEFPECTYKGATPGAPWLDATKEIQKNTGVKIKTVNGPNAYGFNNMAIEYLISKLPGTDQLADYVPRVFQIVSK